MRHQPRSGKHQRGNIAAADTAPRGCLPCQHRDPAYKARFLDEALRSAVEQDFEDTKS
jgi:hypothetical protein